MSSSKSPNDHPNRIPSDRYLWATTPAAKYIRVGEKVNQRYQVVAPQIWQDLRPELLPEMPTQLGEILPYLRLYPHRLHVPEVYGVCQVGDSVITLLENVPIDRNAELYPSMMSMWTKAPAVRQVYWLWQMLALWTPLAEMGVASSLLIPDNLRVEGWRIRLRELDLNPVKDRELAVTTTGSQLNLSNPATETASDDNPAPVAFESATLQQLGACWASWCRKASVSVASQLEEIANLLQTENPSLPDVTSQLNQVLIEQSSRQPLRLQIAGATDSGPRHQHNEDSCYPKMADLPSDLSQPRDPLIPHLSIVCDGIGGHEGGEVASQLAVESIKLQVRALLAEIAEDPEIMPPDLVAQHLSATIRVANNLIASRNDEQQRESRRRMATTLTMALQLPQIVKLPDGQGNAHELYIASVGDSRAYWITSRYCQLLTVDDDVATREVRLGRSLYRQALQRPDAKALTQAVGTRDAELLRPTVQRFILEEDGLLLLCTDGLSDNLSLAGAPRSEANPRLTYDWLEELCADYPRDIFSGKLSLEAAVRSLIEQANQRNGHDNTSIVLTYCAVSPQYPVVLNLGEGLLGNHAYSFNLDTEFTVLPQDLESEEPATPEETALVLVKSRTEWFKVVLGISGVLLVLLIAGTALMTAQFIINPEAFKQMQERFFPQKEQPSATSENSTTTPPTT